MVLSNKMSRINQNTEYRFIPKIDYLRSISCRVSILVQCLYLVTECPNIAIKDAEVAVSFPKKIAVI